MEVLDEFSEIEGKKEAGRKPDFRVMTASKNKDGQAALIQVGAAWVNTSKKGTKYITVSLNKVMLFENDKNGKQ